MARRAAGIGSVVTGLVVVGPLLAPGFVLSYDMVLVPVPRMSAAMIGISGSPPRSVPSALIVSLLSRALTGQVVEKLVLLGIVCGAAYGAARLVPARRPAARVAAGLLYAWSPLTYERLLIGHWALLLGMAVLPWVAGAALRFRRGEPGASWRVGLWLFAAMVPSLYTGILAAAIAAAVALCPPWDRGPNERRARPASRAMTLVGLALATNLPWLVPAALGPAAPQRPLLAMALFRARSDSPLGTVGSLLSLGGLWRTDLAPPGRGGWLWVPVFLIVAGLTVAGWSEQRRRWPRGAWIGLLALAFAGVIVAAAPGTPGLSAVSRWLVRLPGGGVLRDSQKFVIPLALAMSIGFGLGIERVLDAVPPGDRRLGRAGAALALLPIAMAPALAWGASGRLFVSHYPDSWSRAEVVLAEDRAPGAVLALPWHSYLPFGWNRHRPVHQPAQQYFSRPVVASSSLEVGAFRLPEEDALARLAAPVVQGDGPLAPALAKLGVRYVLLFKEADWRREVPRLIGLIPLLDTPELRLYRSNGPARMPSLPTPSPTAVVAADALTVVVVVGSAAMLLRGRRHRSVDSRFGARYTSPQPGGGTEG